MVEIFFNEHKVDIEFSVGDKVLLSLKHLKIMGDRKLVPRFVGPFSIVEWIGPLANQLNLGTQYSQICPIVRISLLKTFRAGDTLYQLSAGAWKPWN